MAARSSIPSLGAIRKRRHRRRQREGVTVVQIEVPASDLDPLIDGGWLDEDESGDKNRLGEAILRAAEERIRQRS